MSSIGSKTFFGFVALLLCFTVAAFTHSLAAELPDLTPTDITAPTSAVTQHQIEVSWTVQNQGNGEAKPTWADRLYLSTDEVLDGHDTQLITPAWTETVATGETYTSTYTVMVPNVPASNYYLILYADSHSYLYEADEENNQIHRSIIVTGPEGFRIVAIEHLPNGRLRIDFTSISELIHQLQWSDAIEEGGWLHQQFYITEDGTEPQDSIVGTGTIMTIYVPPAPSPGFYRILIP
jgi:hypothetical protein